MRDVALLLNDMRSAGVVLDYALFGAAAQMRYTEPLATLDADVLVSLPAPNRLDILTPIYDFCAARGFRPEGETVLVGRWPVQFVPVFDRVTEAALRNAETADFDGVPFRVVRADYLAVIALSVGRPKDYARVLALIESGAASRQDIRELASQHGLQAAWDRFAKRFFDD